MPHCPFACIISYEKFAINLICVALNIMCLSSLAAFKISSSYWFWTIWIWCVSAYFIFLGFQVCWASWTCEFVVFFCFGFLNPSLVIFWLFFFFQILHLPFGDSSYTYLKLLKLSLFEVIPIEHWCSFHFFFLFSSMCFFLDSFYCYLFKFPWVFLFVCFLFSKV